MGTAERWLIVTVNSAPGATVSDERPTRKSTLAAPGAGWAPCGAGSDAGDAGAVNGAGVQVIRETGVSPHPAATTCVLFAGQWFATT